MKPSELFQLRHKIWNLMFLEDKQTRLRAHVNSKPVTRPGRDSPPCYELSRVDTKTTCGACVLGKNNAVKG